MTYDEKIPEFALQPAKAADEKPIQEQVDDGFDPTPYDRLLEPARQEEKEIVEEEMPASHVEVNEQLDIKEELKPQETAEAVVDEEEIEPVLLNEEATKEKETVSPSEPVKLTPLAAAAVYNDLKVTTVAQSLETKLFIEEDILVPDVKPDLISILSMDGKALLSNKEIQVGQGEEDSVKVTGEISLQTIYLPEEKNDGEVISIIQSRLPFKTDWQVTASPMSHLSITPEIERIDYTVVNERKFRAKVTLNLQLKEYAEKEMELFESLKGEELQLLKEKVKISHVALRKEDSVEISEDLKLKEGSLRPVKILKTDINVVENHKQITSEKMVINAAIWTNILYIGEEEKDGEVQKKPALFQGKTDFTQFILMDKEENVAANKVAFNDKDLEIKINEEEGDSFTLKGTVNTSIQIYRNMEKETVSDLYHNVKDMTYDLTEKNVEAIIGTGTTEVSAREIMDVPPQNGPVDKVIYINGTIKEKSNKVEDGRVLVEGILEGQVLCLPEEEDKSPFAIKKDIPFRGTMEVASANESMSAESQLAIKDLWFDKINSKQIEINASLQMETTVIEQKTLKLIKNPCFIENDQKKRPSSMVIYITKRDDSLWKIAKKYKTSISAIKEINELAEEPKLAEGTRLLIVK